MSMFQKLSHRAFLTIARFLAPKAKQTHQDEILQIPSRDSGRTIKAHIYRSQTTKKPSPVLINFHGSGFVFPLHGTDDEFAQYVSKNTQYTVLDCQYRLAPENPFPAAPNDAEDVVKYVLAHPEDYDSSSISVSGFSAGGNLALGVAGHVFPQSTFRNMLAFYPVTDLSIDAYSKVAPDTTGRPIPAWMANMFDNCYAPEPTDRKQPLISPSYIEPSNYPDNVLIITCACDTLAPEAEDVAKRIKAVAGKNVVDRRMEGCNHAWDKGCAPGSAQETAKHEAYDLAVKMLQM